MNAHRHIAHRPASPRWPWLALGLVAGIGCTDPQGRYDAFIERTADARMVDAGNITPSQRFDFSGHYLLALATTLAPDQPLLFASDVQVAADLGTLDLDIQPLTTDQSSPPRTPVGTPLSLQAVAYAEDGSFSADLGSVQVPGDANPISGSEIVAQVSIHASAHPESAAMPAYFCGTASGMVSVPIPLDLAGSTIGALAASDLTSVQPLAACPK